MDWIIKRCPFCGNNVHTKMHATQTKDGKECLLFSIRCQDCDIEKTLRIMGHDHDFIDIEQSICELAEKWNQRA